MKGTKKLLSILMVLTLVLSLGASALAAEKTVEVSLPAQYASHKMVAYQIFTGAQASDEEYGQNQLGITGWAANVNSEDLLSALITKYGDEKFNTGMNAVAAAKAISEMNLTGDAAYEFAKLVKEYITGDGVEFEVGAGEGAQPKASLNSGYWIIIDETTPSDTENFAYSAYLLQVVGVEGEIPVQPKFDVPEVDKQVADQNDSKTDAQTWGEVADWDIGDSVPFQITATMPGTIEGYKSYKLVFHDEMDAGLTLPKDAVFSLTIDNITIDQENGNWTVETSVDNASGKTTITVTIPDALKLGAKENSKIVLSYSAVLNENAVIGDPGNPNTVSLQYSNNPNNSGAGNPDTGTTPPDTVVVFTFKLDVDKVQPNPEDPDATKALEGAGFTLYKFDADSTAEDKWVAVGDEVMADENGGKFTASFKGLDEGQYKLVETTVPDGFNKADDVYFTVVATYEDNNSSDNVIDGETGTKLVTLIVEDVTGAEVADFVITITTGNIATSILNTEGLHLPETGGIGTTIFYIAGALLVAAAVVLLVTKRRVNGAEK